MDTDLLGDKLYVPGIYPHMPMAEYLRLPAVSAGVIRAIADGCPLLGWHNSFLNVARDPKVDDDDSEEPKAVARDDDASNESDFGTIAHSIVLEGHIDKVTIIDPNDHPAKTTGSIPAGWTNVGIRNARDSARAEGKTPVLKPTYAKILECVSSVRAYIDLWRDVEPGLWALMQPGGGLSEATILWQDGDHLCRMRPDRVALNGAVIVDLKFTKTDPDPGQFSKKQITRMGYYTKAAHYLRGARAHFGIGPNVELPYVFLVASMTPPYLVSSVGLRGEWMELGERKRDYAMKLWDKCRRENYWPGYSPNVAWPDSPPPWEEEAFNERIGLEADGMPREE